eukprot:2019024-Rhodomonas_salina.1
MSSSKGNRGESRDQCDGRGVSLRQSQVAPYCAGLSHGHRDGLIRSQSLMALSRLRGSDAMVNRHRISAVTSLSRGSQAAACAVPQHEPRPS